MTHENFVRISWEEARNILKEALQEKYKTTGNIRFMTDSAYEGIYEAFHDIKYVDCIL